MRYSKPKIFVTSEVIMYSWFTEIPRKSLRNCSMQQTAKGQVHRNIFQLHILFISLRIFWKIIENITEKKGHRGLFSAPHLWRPKPFTLSTGTVKSFKYNGMVKLDIPTIKLTLTFQKPVILCCSYSNQKRGRVPDFRKVIRTNTQSLWS